MARKKTKKLEDLTKDELICLEIDKLTRTFENIDKDKMIVCSEMIKNAAFMSVTLQELQKEMNKGLVETYQNGPNQSGTRISPAAQIYTKLIANYNAVIKQLISLLPPSEKSSAKTVTDPMALFISSK